MYFLTGNLFDWCKTSRSCWFSYLMIVSWDYTSELASGGVERKISPGKWIQSENHFPTTCTFFGILSWYCNLFLLIHIICSHKKIIYLISAWLKHPFTIPLITYFKKPSNDLLHGKLNICWSAWKPQVLRTKSDVIFEGVIITANHSLRSNHKNRWNGVKNTTSRCACHIDDSMRLKSFMTSIDS